MFAILLEALLIEVHEEIPHFVGSEGGGLLDIIFVSRIAKQ